MESTLKPQKENVEQLIGVTGSVKKKVDGLEKAIGEVKVFFETGDWTKAKPVHVLATYCVFYERVYEDQPLEIIQEKARVRKFASNAFGMVFKGDWALYIEYVRWIWKRERERIEYQKRRGNRQATFRQTYRLFFGRSMDDFMFYLQQSR
jgi:transglutaminase-like putative cysteine protease